ncbi:MAG TPA: type II toxin-antitoxin system HicB family antitoxin [Terriglobia bacterium]|nr:type II toxin-antitoxin system HicB family antitoxin [Terriglobia bacterium]
MTAKNVTRQDREERIAVDRTLAKVREAEQAARQERQEQMADVDEAAIRLHIEALDDGGYLATSADVPGLVAEGRSISEAVEIAQGLARKIAESCLEHGDPLPPALAQMRSLPLDLLIPVGVR